LYCGYREPVASATDCLHDSIVTKLLEALAQAANAHVDHSRIGAASSSPHAELEKIARKHLVGMLEEQLKEPAFRRSQSGAPGAATNDSPLIVNLQLGELAR
jgi:hypothetical protein